MTHFVLLIASTHISPNSQTWQVVFFPLGITSNSQIRHRHSVCTICGIPARVPKVQLKTHKVCYASAQGQLLSHLCHLSDQIKAQRYFEDLIDFPRETYYISKANSLSLKQSKMPLTKKTSRQEQRRKQVPGVGQSSSSDQRRRSMIERRKEWIL